jgi:energy-converting hydrogenase Eha subunit B
LTAAVAEALRTRNVPELIALVTAELAVLAVYTAFDRWCAPPTFEATYTELARTVLLQLHAAAAAIT